MTLAEYKAWLSGYVVSFKDGVPDADQWVEIARILATVKEPSIPFAPYAPRLPDSMTAPWDPIRPYWADSPTTSAPQWPCGVPVVTC